MRRGGRRPSGTASVIPTSLVPTKSGPFKVRHFLPDTHQPAARHFSIIQNWVANSTLVVQLFSNETRDQTTKTGSPRAVKLRPFEGSSRRGRSPAAVSRKGFSSGRGVTPKPGSHRSPKPLGPYGVPVAGGQQITKTSRVLNEGKVS